MPGQRVWAPRGAQGAPGGQTSCLGRMFGAIFPGQHPALGRSLPIGSVEEAIYSEHAKIQKLSLWLKGLGPPHPPLCKQSQARYLTKSTFLLLGLRVWDPPTPPPPRPKGVRARPGTPRDPKSHLFVTKWVAMAPFGTWRPGSYAEFRRGSRQGGPTPSISTFFLTILEPKNAQMSIFVNFSKFRPPPPSGFGVPWGPWGPYGAHGAHGGPMGPIMAPMMPMGAPGAPATLPPPPLSQRLNPHTYQV